MFYFFTLKIMSSPVLPFVELSKLALPVPVSLKVDPALYFVDTPTKRKDFCKVVGQWTPKSFDTLHPLQK
mgnify:FL=1